MEAFVLNSNLKIICDEGDYAGLKTVADWVRNDLKKVFGEPGGACTESEGSKEMPEANRAVIVGTIERSKLLKELADRGVINQTGLSKEDGSAKWEVYKVSAVNRPLEGIDEALIIQGSDKRGAIYGLLSISEACGVSPFVNWSDATPQRKESVTLYEDFFTVSKEPSVRYRGIFINDEWPAFGSWATKRFGGVNASCYSQIFELLLRLRANYMWPAMWASNFSMDGPGIESARLADELGIVMSTSHHEPCMRTGEEYSLLRGPESPYGDAWDFLSNREGIIRFWEDGLKRNAPFENVITMGMRGERDTAIMASATLEENIALLKDIIRTQNELIRKYINPDLTKVPRQIVLFTEVEKFYYGDENTPGLIDDPEMDGITVVFSDNNYGYTRTLPTRQRRERNGGYGMYYHVDMHGGAYSYEWIGSTFLPRIWDQLTTTYDYGVRNIWVVNVGDLVSQELEVSYIMKLAFDIEAFGVTKPNQAPVFVSNWLKQIFGGYFQENELAKLQEIIWGYSLINERCKHEVMNERVYHPVHNDEARSLYILAKRVMLLCDELLAACPEQIYTAFYELIYYPAYGTANLHRTWMASMWNKFYVNQNRNTANLWNEEIDEGIKADAKLIEDFHALADGKFYGHALSEHFGFRFWNDSNNQLPTRVYVYPAYKKRMLVSKKDKEWYFDGREYTVREKTLTDFLRPDVEWIVLEVSCASRIETQYSVSIDVPWLEASKYEGRTSLTDEIVLRIDRNKLGEGTGTATVVISDNEDCFVTLHFEAEGADYCDRIARMCGLESAKELEGALLERDGVVAIEAGDYRKLQATNEAYLQLLLPYGRTWQGLKMYPNTFDGIGRAVGELPYAEYMFVSEEEREYEACFVFAPSLPVNDSNSQCFAVELNDTGVIKVDTVLDSSKPIFNSGQWANDNRRNAKIIPVKLKGKRGLNTLKYTQINPNLILERIVLRDAGTPEVESYLGPSRSYCF